MALRPKRFPAGILRWLGIAALCAGLGGHAFGAVGANTPFTSFEAEAGAVEGGATVHMMQAPLPTGAMSPEQESSGKGYVELKGTGQSVSWKNTTSQSFTAINVRYSIPSSPDGAGIDATLNLYVDGALRQSIALNSHQIWLYGKAGGDGMSRVPEDPPANVPHRYFDEIHTFIQGAPVAPNSTITLRQDADNTAEFYWIDVVDLEAPPPPGTPPDGALSIADFGAVPNDRTADNYPAIQKCFDAAAKAPSKTAWIPAGTYYMRATNALRPKGITVAGAGMWYSLIYQISPPNKNKPGLASPCIMEPVSATIQNLALDQNAPTRKDADGDGGGINIKGEHWVIDGVWVQHTASGVWGDGEDGLVQNSRMDSTWGDGININNGNSGNKGNNLTVKNNFVRGTGDDGLAINSDISSILMVHPVVINNTSVAPWWANGIGIYGGRDILVQDNLVLDGSSQYGISIGVFGAQGSPLESGAVQGNVMVRSGGNAHGSHRAALGIGTQNEPHSIANVYVGGNTATDAVFEGIVIQKGFNVTIQGNVVQNPGTDGIVVNPKSVGVGILNGNTVKDLKPGHADLVKGPPDKYTIVTPTMAADFSEANGGPAAKDCPEGGKCVGGIANGSYTAYSGVNLDHATAFTARVGTTAAGGSIAIHADSASGPLIGTCAVPPAGDSGTWISVTCDIADTPGTHAVYLVYTGDGGPLFDVEWFAFVSVPAPPPAPAH